MALASSSTGKPIGTVAGSLGGREYGPGSARRAADPHLPLRGPLSLYHGPFMPPAARFADRETGPIPPIHGKRPAVRPHLAGAALQYCGSERPQPTTVSATVSSRRWQRNDHFLRLSEVVQRRRRLPLDYLPG